MDKNKLIFLERIGLLSFGLDKPKDEIGFDKDWKALYKVTLDGVDYYATMGYNGSINIGPPIPQKTETSL